MRKFDRKCIVIICNLDFIITDIILIKNIKLNIEINDPVSKLVSNNNLTKFLHFTLTLQNEKVSFGDEIGILDDNNLSNIMDLGGVEYRNKYIITVFSNYVSLYRELNNINNGPINYLREKMEYFSVSPGSYQELSGVNNEVINMQRELYKKNKVISDLMNKEKEMNKELEVLNSTKDRIFSIIGHDLRGPLSNIIQSMNLIAYDKLIYEEWQQENYFSKLSDSAANTMHLLENLLDWSKSQLGELSFFPKSYILLESMRSVIELLKGAAVEKKIIIVEELNCNPNVYGDRRMIEVILRNLISNAIKFTNEGGKINVKVSMEEEFAKIMITDNGLGMSPEKIETLFDLTKNNVVYGTKGEKGKIGRAHV